MKYGIFAALLLLSLFFPTNLDSSHRKSFDHTIYVNKLEEQRIEYLLEENKEFKEVLGSSESTNNPDTVNIIGAMGYWQFMPSTLKSLGYKGITPYRFRRNPGIFPKEMQEEALDKKISTDLGILTKQWYRDSTTNINYLEKYVGTKIMGVEITVAGIVAACHLGGAGGTMRFLDSKGKKNPDDIFGTSIYHYLKKFSGYTYHYETPLKKKLQCIRNSRNYIEDLTPLSRLSRWYSEATVVLSATETASTLSMGIALAPTSATKLDLSVPGYMLHCQNTTEVFYINEALQLRSGTAFQQVGTEKLNGTTLANGWVVSCLPKQHLFHQVQEHISPISNQFGTHLGISNLLTSFQYLCLRRLKNLPHLGVG